MLVCKYNKMYVKFAYRPWTANWSEYWFSVRLRAWKSFADVKLFIFTYVLHIILTPIWCRHPLKRRFSTTACSWIFSKTRVLLVRHSPQPEKSFPAHRGVTAKETIHYPLFSCNTLKSESLFLESETMTWTGDVFLDHFAFLMTAIRRYNIWSR